jgi:cytochrome c oxidase subunit 3
VPGVDTAAGPAAASPGAAGGVPPSAQPSGRDRSVPGRPSILGVGVVVWLSSELMFFAGLFGSWFTLRSSSADWPPEDVHLAVARTAVATVVLIASSATMHMAVVAAERADRRKLVRWLAATAVLGAIFLTNQALEYAELEFSISTHAYGSIFYLMTGFHGLHVLGGIFFMIATIALVAGKSEAPPGPPVTVCGYYWHFVDVVWVAMFATIYLIG